MDDFMMMTFWFDFFFPKFCGDCHPVVVKQ